MSATAIESAPNAHHIRNLVKGAVAGLTGRQRGADREVRRDSYDVDDERAKPWSRIGDGSAAYVLVWKESLLVAADAVRKHEYARQREGVPFTATLREGSKAMTIVAARGARFRIGKLVKGPGIVPGTFIVKVEGSPLGHEVTLNRQAQRSAGEVELTLWIDRLQRTDVTVLAAVLEHLKDFATGRLFPALDSIAEVAGCSRRAVVEGLRRLKARGFLSWVRRSRVADAKGQAGPQREQTSNAYFFEHRQRMHRKVWSRFQAYFLPKLARIRGNRRGDTIAPPRAPDPAPTATSWQRPDDPQLAGPLDRMAATLGLPPGSVSA
jgi:hypothetical protein